MSEKHTPGPWHAWQSGSEWIVSSKHEDHPLWMHDQFGGTHNVAATIARPANARLIAAAPALLEACREALSDLVLINAHHGGLGEQLRAAIALAQPAEGGEKCT